MRSKKYTLVKKYYDSGMWSKAMVHNAVGRWITAEEYEMITGEAYTESDDDDVSVGEALNILLGGVGIEASETVEAETGD